MPIKWGKALLLGLLGALLLTGCGRNNLPAGYYGGNYPSTPIYSTPTYNQPNYGSMPYGSGSYSSYPYGSIPYDNNGYSSYPYNPTIPQRPTVPPLVASIEGIQNGEFLGIGRFVVQVRILNPTPMPVSGMLRIDFMAGSKVYRTTRDRVMLGPGQSTDKTYEDPSWRVNNAHVAIESDTPFTPMSGAMPTDPSLNYGQPFLY